MQLTIPDSMDDFVDIGAFAPGDGLGAPPYVQWHRIRSGTQTIRITVLSPKLREGREPARAGIDPWRKLIERGREDNVVEAKSARADAAGAGS